MRSSTAGPTASRSGCTSTRPPARSSWWSRTAVPHSTAPMGMASGCLWSAASWTTPARIARSRDAGAAARWSRSACPSGRWRRPGTGHWTPPLTPDRRYRGAACGNQYGSSWPTTTMRSSKASAWCCRPRTTWRWLPWPATAPRPCRRCSPTSPTCWWPTPGFPGLEIGELVRLVGTAQPATRVLLLAEDALSAPTGQADPGPAGTTRAVSGHELAEAIRQMAAGGWVTMAPAAPATTTPTPPARPERDDSLELFLCSLSERERQVLALLGGGYGNRRIAEICNLSLNTVRTHVQNVLVKLGVHSKLEAAAIAVRHGLVHG